MKNCKNGGKSVKCTTNLIVILFYPKENNSGIIGELLKDKFLVGSEMYSERRSSGLLQYFSARYFEILTKLNIVIQVVAYQGYRIYL